MNELKVRLEKSEEELKRVCEERDALKSALEEKSEVDLEGELERVKERNSELEEELKRVRENANESKV